MPHRGTRRDTQPNTPVSSPLVDVGLLEVLVYSWLHSGHLTSEISISLMESDVKAHKRDGTASAKRILYSKKYVEQKSDSDRETEDESKGTMIKCTIRLGEETKHKYLYA